MIAQIERPMSLPDMLTIDQVAALARVSPSAVHRAVFLTRQGKSHRGAAYYLVRASRMRAGFRAEDVLEWLAARKQTPVGFEGLAPKRKTGLARPIAGEVQR